MFKRSLLLPLAILVFVGQNLPNPCNPTGLRIVDMARPTAAFGRMYDLTFEPVERTIEIRIRPF